MAKISSSGIKILSKQEPPGTTGSQYHSYMLVRSTKYCRNILYHAIKSYHGVLLNKMDAKIKHKSQTEVVNKNTTAFIIIRFWQVES